MGNSIFQELQEKFSKKHEEIKASVLQKHKNALTLVSTYPMQLAAGFMGAALLTTNTLPTVPPQQLPVAESAVISPTGFTISDLHQVLPPAVQPLTQDEESQVSKILSRDFNMPVSASLDGIRLNTSYGIIGQEQHLALYPGDNIGVHFNRSSTSVQDAAAYADKGMAPGLGAWGYFAPSKYDLTQKDIEREKYYIAVQTFLAPGFHEDVRRYIEFFKYRKMIVVNPENGKAMVVDIADAGPGESTGKQLGGSPEVMRHLGRKDGAQRGPVLYFFIDDPNDTIPLGPVEAIQ